MVKIKYLIIGSDLAIFVVMLIIGGIFVIYLPAEVFQGAIYLTQLLCFLSLLILME